MHAERTLLDAFVSLNRPEYSKSPEVLQAAMAHALLPGAHNPVGEGRRAGLVFEQLAASKSKVVRLVQTRPSQGELERFWACLEASGIHAASDLDRSAVSESLLNSLRGTTAQKAKAYSATPLVLACALLQDPVGMHAKLNPPDFALIVEQVFALGARQGSAVAARDLWRTAISTHDRQPLFRALDMAVAKWLLESHRIDVDEARKAEILPPEIDVAPWLAASPTPFSWFHRSWRQFCTEDWRVALPRQRWADWATCILRTGIGMAFLWESSFYQKLGRELLSDGLANEQEQESVLRQPMPLLEWHDRGSPLSVKDQNSRIIRTVVDGLAVRQVLAGVKLPNPGGVAWETLSSAVAGARDALSDAGRIPDLEAAFGQPRRSAANNTIETIQYLLSCRSRFGPEADLYGLLQRESRRHLVVSPGEEWIVVLASMSAVRPGSPTLLRDVRMSLKELGIIASRESVVSELERAGLTRSSHDSDDAIVVRSGF